MKSHKGLSGFPAFLARRYLFSGGEPRFASFLTIVAVLGVALGVATLIVTTSVMSGFSRDLEYKLIGFNPHVTVFLPDSNSVKIVGRIRKKFSGIREIAPFVTGEVIVEAGGGGSESAIGAKILGFVRIPERMRRTTEFYWGGGMHNEVWWHSFLPPLEGGVVLGNEMLYQIGVHPDFGDSVQIITPFGGIDPFGNPAPVRREYRVVGGFKSGFFEYDVKYVLMSFAEAGRLLKDQGRYGLRIMLADGSRAGRYVKDIQRFLGPTYTVSGWDEKNKRLFAALRLERYAMTSLLFLIVVIASFSIVGVTIMIFYSKRRDLAVLMAMGATRKKILKIFLCHGGLIGISGVVIGLTIGLIASYAIERSHIVLPPSYYLDYLPVTVNYLTVVCIAVGGFIMSVFAAYYPATRAARIDPLELLRSE